ncbi:ribosome-associated translation inhibitor RaiA [bacterium]|nr:ribosome-associated translation inhibitor RaiA [bacterium]
MHIYVNGRNIEITDAIKAYVKEKFGKVANHYDQIEGIDVVLSVIKNPAATGKHVAEVSCKLTTGTVRCEESAESMYASIDLLADKLDRQVKKFKDKATGDDKSSIRTEELKAE